MAEVRLLRYTRVYRDGSAEKTCANKCVVYAEEFDIREILEAIFEAENDMGEPEAGGAVFVDRGVVKALCGRPCYARGALPAMTGYPDGDERSDEVVVEYGERRVKALCTETDWVVYG